MLDSECVFCRIIAGELPSAKVFEDANILAFLDIGPIAKGHTLVIPKQHYADICATPPRALGEIMHGVKAVAQAQFKALNAHGVNVTQANGRAAGQVVPHIHFHVIPRCGTAASERTWTPVPYADPAEMESYATRLREACLDL